MLLECLLYATAGTCLDSISSLPHFKIILLLLSDRSPNIIITVAKLFIVWASNLEGDIYQRRRPHDCSKYLIKIILIRWRERKGMLLDFSGSKVAPASLPSPLSVWMLLVAFWQVSYFTLNDSVPITLHILSPCLLFEFQVFLFMSGRWEQRALVLRASPEILPGSVLFSWWIQWVFLSSVLVNVFAANDRGFMELDFSERVSSHHIWVLESQVGQRSTRQNSECTGWTDEAAWYWVRPLVHQGHH